MGKRKRERRRRKLVRKAARELSGFVLGAVAAFVTERLSDTRKHGRQDEHV